MKKALSIIAAGAFIVALSSCSKCRTCTYSNDIGDSVETESCGSSSDNDDFQADITSQWGSFGTVTCTED